MADAFHCDRCEETAKGDPLAIVRIQGDVLDLCKGCSNDLLNWMDSDDTKSDSERFYGSSSGTL